MSVAAFVRTLADAGMDGPSIAKAVESYEAASSISTKCPVPRARVKNGSKFGPKERWGYRGPITPRLSEKEWWPLRASILRRDDYTCQYCGEEPDRMCADHVVPLSRGGSNEPDNLTACCLPCNASKQDRLLSEWKGRYR